MNILRSLRVIGRYAERPINHLSAQLSPLASMRASLIRSIIRSPRLLAQSLLVILSSSIYLPIGASPPRTSLKSPPPSPKQAVISDDQLPTAAEHPLRYQAIDLYQQADHGHLQLIGPMLSPGAPSWKQLSSAQVSSAFREPQRLNGKLVSWLEGKGSTITFPVSESEHSLEELLIWIHPVAPHQIVSIFIDEQLVKNLSLKSKGSFYRLLLPKPLSLGEHSLRLYFRFTRPASWGGRTPGAIGPLSFVPRGQREQMPERWAGEVIYEQRRWGALFAPPPATWRFYFFPPRDATLKANLYLPPLAPTTRFQVLAATDTLPERVILDQELHAEANYEARSIPIEVSLGAFIGQATRLTLKTHHVSDHPLAKRRPKKARVAPDEIGWLAPRVESLYPPPHELARANRMIIWSIEGLKLERLLAKPELIDQLPSLRMLLKQSVRFTRLWSDEYQPIGGHKLLLSPPHSRESIVSMVKRAGGQSVYIGSTNNQPLELDVDFNQTMHVDPDELEGHPHQTLLAQVQQISRIRQTLKTSARRKLLNTPPSPSGRHSPVTKRGPELIYIHSPRETTSRRKYPFSLTSQEKLWLAELTLSKSELRRYEVWLNRLKELDYSLALLLSELSLSPDRDATALLLVGTVGAPRKVTLPTPETLRDHLETSALYYSPQFKWDQPKSVDRAHMSALSDTISQILIGPEFFNQTEEGRGSLAPFILSGAPLPPLVDIARRGHHQLTRVQDYYLFERPHSPVKLWRSPLTESGPTPPQLQDLAPSSPVLLRTLRDRIMISSLFQGLESVR